jgi:hypothetical protein
VVFYSEVAGNMRSRERSPMYVAALVLDAAAAAAAVGKSFVQMPGPRSHNADQLRLTPYGLTSQPAQGEKPKAISFSPGSVA